MGGVEKGVGRKWAGLEGELGLVVKDCQGREFGEYGGIKGKRARGHWVGHQRAGRGGVGAELKQEGIGWGRGNPAASSIGLESEKPRDPEKAQSPLFRRLIYLALRLGL